MVTNKQIAEKFTEFAEILELQGGDRFRITAYERAAQEISSHGTSLEQIYKEKGKKGLQEIEGIGEGISERIEEFIKTGKVKELENLRKGSPEAEVEFMRIPGVGPKTAVKLYKKLKAKSVDDLKEKLAKQGSKYFKERSLNKILKGIGFLKTVGKRMLLDEALLIAGEVVDYLKKPQLAQNITPVGSLRRMKETVGDIDIVASSNQPAKFIEYFAKYDGFKQIIAKGQTKCSAIHRDGCQIDLEILPEDKFGSLLQHFTGSKEHNVHLRTYAQEHGMSVSEHGIKIKKGRKEELILCSSEQIVYKTLGMSYIEPELREDRGEIEAALRRELPKLVEHEDIKGDFHVHSVYSDGNDSINTMVKKAIELGYEYVAISDHTVGLGAARGLDKSRFAEREKEIDKVQKSFPKIKILNSCEVNIRPDGTLDLPDDFLKTFDIVVASAHSSFDQLKDQYTKRLIKVAENKNIDIIGHPTGRLINRREGFEADWEEVFKACRKNSVALEINCYPRRLDLPDNLVFEARKLGIKFSTSTDAHEAEAMEIIPYGLSVARRGWCEKKDVLNSYPLGELMKFLG